MEVNERAGAGARAEVQEKRINEDGCCYVDTCVHFFVHTLHQHTFPDDFVSLFPSARIFFPIVACPPLSLSPVTSINIERERERARERASAETSSCVFHSFSASYRFFPSFLSFLALMYVCRRQMRVYIQKKKRLRVKKTNTRTYI